MLTVQEIKTFIDNDAASRRKQLAKVGVRYYEADHDIKNFRICYVDANGKLQEDRFKSNIKISHPFFTEIVDQQVQYMLSGKGGFMRSDLPDLQDYLDTYFNENEDFRAELEELLTDTVVKGFGNMYAYKNAEGLTAFQCADSMGVVEVKAKETDDGCDYVIYWYVDRIGKDHKEIKRIEVWDDKFVHYFVQAGDGAIDKDESKPINPRPHAVFKKKGDVATYYEGFGFIPFFRLDNNRKQFSGLKPIKPLIDDYDLMSCGLSNNIQDSNEVLYVVKGFQGNNLDELQLNLRSKKMIGIPEAQGGVEIQTIDIPYQARQAKLELDEKNIYRFGMGFNAAQVGDGNVTNVVIKSRYALLDLKANKLEIRLQQFLRKLLKVILAEINDMHGTDYQQKDVYIVFDREIMTNASDNAQIELTDAQKQQTQITTLLNLATYLGDELLMQNICDVLDLDYNDIVDKLPKREADDLYAAQDALAKTQPEADDPIVVEGLRA